MNPICLVAVAILAATATIVAAPVPKDRQPPFTILVLDDCDPDFRGKEQYEDSLTALDPTGNVQFRVTGLNGCQSIGSSRLIAGDPTRGHIWVVETVGHRLLQFDRAGRQRLGIPHIMANSLAVDPETGNVWVVVTRGTIYGTGVDVYDPSGTKVAAYPVRGYDICYDPKGKAFWLAGKELTKVSAAKGDVLFQTDIAVWCSSSVAVHPTTGRVWVTVRKHSQIAASANRLLAFDNNGTERFAVELDDAIPFNVSIDPGTGDGWVTILRHSVRRYTADGKLVAEHEVTGAFTAVAPGVGGDVWVVTQKETVRMTTAGKPVHRIKHERETGQAWVAVY